MNDNSRKVLLKEDIDIESKNYKDIIKELDLTDDDKIICESIIYSMEKYIIKNIKEDKTVQIPFIGCIRKNHIKAKLIEDKEELRLLRKTNNKETYKSIVRNKINSYKEELNKKDRDKLQIKKLISIYKKEYELYSKTIGVAFANMFIYGKTLFKDIPFDPEVQKMYDELNKLNK
jgi:hypothetical protein